MNTLRHLFSAVLLSMLVCLTPVVHADSWMPPKPSVTYESAAQDARFVVTSTGQTSALSNCSGSLYIKSPSNTGDDWLKVWEKPLQNKLSPVTALVANNGWRVVTFDNYYTVGYGNEVVVIYNEKGDLLKKYSLEMLLSPEELGQVSRTVSSRWWRKKVAIVDELGLLKVEVALRKDQVQTIKTLRFNLLDGERIEP